MTNRIILISSLVVNAVLLMTVVGVIPFLLFLSLLLNVGLVWLVMRLMSRLEESSEDVESLLESVSNLGNHINAVHEMEMFYGEPILQGMMEHIEQVVQEIDEYREKYSDIEEVEEETEIDDREEEA